MMFYRFFLSVERKAAKLQGKGWGSTTVRKEFAAAVSLLTSRNPQICIDIGANKGTYTYEVVRKFPKCRIVIFEPAKSNTNILKNKFGTNSNVVIEQTGVSNKVGGATLFSDKDGSGLASLTKRRLDHFGIEFNHKETITTIRFEDYWKEKLGSGKIDILKIDIEGHELDALAGFGDSLNYIEVIQFEFGGCNIDTRTFFRDFWYFFKESGFDLYRITPFGVLNIAKYRELDEFYSTCNYLAKQKA